MNKLYSQIIGQGPDLVLLHGWGAHSGIWRSIVDNLSQGFRLTILDLPGFGRSKSSSDYSMQQIIQEVLLVAPSQALWLGWSMGGLIAMQIARQYPERVKKLIMVASSPCFIKEKNWPGIEVQLLKKFAESLSQDYEATIKRFLLLQFHGISFDKATLRGLLDDFLFFGKPNTQALKAGLQLLEKTDLRSELRHIKCPILYLLGRLDALVPWHISQYLDNYPHIQTTVLQGAGHALFLSHPQQFLMQVKTFGHE